MKLNRLKQVRESANKSQNDVAAILNISVTTYRLYESGKRNLSSEMYRKLAGYYGVDLSYLMSADLISYSSDDNANFAQTEEERELLSLFRSLSPYLQDLTLSNVRSWANSASKVYRDNRKQ